ncbi:MAG: hypothetical protein ACM3TN_13760 [Alphaproteobacteria bacterium]
MKYRITEVNGWVIVNHSGKPENNEPLRVKHLFKKWFTQQGVRVIVNLKDLSQFGVWEVGLITSFKKEVDQRAGTLRLCSLNALRALYPGHGRVSNNPIEDIDCAIANAQKMLDANTDKRPEIFYQKSAFA